MPRYNPALIEPKWQQFWEANRTFKTPDMPQGQKLYVLDMFPYPSGDGLHVGHPEGYTATDIVCRFERMRGKSVLHPMGFDAFGLPAEEHAIKTNTPPRESTERNIATFRRQLKMLGFSYDWDRELATTDVGYFRWTQWIFLVLFDTWFDEALQKGRPIAELPIPAEVQTAGEAAVRRYQDEHRLAYQSDALVNWCAGLGTVLANEEVIDGKSERGGHPVTRIPLRQWMLRITAYANRLEKDLAGLDWSHSIKEMQRDWIGRSVGAEVDFYVGQGSHLAPRDEAGVEDSHLAPRDEAGVEGSHLAPRDEAGVSAQAVASVTVSGSVALAPATSRGARGLHAEREGYEAWKAARAKSGYPRKPEADVLRIYTTRPDTLFGATYMVIAPEHPFVAKLTTPEQKAAVEAYCASAAAKSDRDRTEATKTKTGVFTGSYSINPANDQPIPVWIADYVLISYGTGAIMAVPAHDERDFQFAWNFNLPIKLVVLPNEKEYSPEFVDLFARYFNDGYFELVRVLNETASSLQAKFDAHPDLCEHVKVVEQNGVFLLWNPASKRFPPVRTDYSLLLRQPYVSSGIAFNSQQYDKLPTDEFKAKITDDLTAAGVGRAAVNYKLRDWLFSRQRFWGEPFPILHELDEKGEPNGLLRAISPHDLPVDLPHLDDYKPHGRPEPPLGKAPAEWLYPTIEGKRYRRETNTMPQWAGSCWYFLRFIDPTNERVFVDPVKEKAWMPIDLYVGGAEHAVLHLLYARFWHKVLFDRGHVSTPEPFQKLVNQGMILGEVEYTGYKAADGSLVSSADVTENEEGKPVLKKGGALVTTYKLEPEQVEKQGDVFVIKSQSTIRVDSRAYKMSKSRGNVVNPDAVVKEYGADSLRLFEMFMGPLEAVKPWSMAGVNGVRNFLDRVWRMIIDMHAETPVLNAAVQDVPPTDEQNRVLHKTIQAVTNDLAHMEFNTAIARMMEFVNHFTKESVRPKSAMERFVLLLSPYAPHIAEELWQLLGHEKSLAYEPWPAFDEAFTRDDTIEVPVQIKGKLRGKVTVPAGTDQAGLEAAARSDPRIAELLAEQTVVKVIVVPGRLVNFVTK